jgi:hypothetical protein
MLSSRSRGAGKGHGARAVCCPRPLRSLSTSPAHLLASIARAATTPMHPWIAHDNGLPRSVLFHQTTRTIGQASAVECRAVMPIEARTLDWPLAAMAFFFGVRHAPDRIACRACSRRVWVNCTNDAQRWARQLHTQKRPGAAQSVNATRWLPKAE